MADRLVITKTDIADERHGRSLAAAAAGDESVRAHHDRRRWRARSRAAGRHRSAKRRGTLRGAGPLAECDSARIASARSEGGSLRQRIAPRTGAHDAAIHAFCLWFDEPFTWEGLNAALQALTSLRGPDLLRVKGIVHVAGERGSRGAAGSAACVSSAGDARAVAEIPIHGRASSSSCATSRVHRSRHCSRRWERSAIQRRRDHGITRSSRRHRSRHHGIRDVGKSHCRRISRARLRRAGRAPRRAVEGRRSSGAERTRRRREGTDHHHIAALGGRLAPTSPPSLRVPTIADRSSSKPARCRSRRRNTARKLLADTGHHACSIAH